MKIEKKRYTYWSLWGNCSLHLDPSWVIEEQEAAVKQPGSNWGFSVKDTSTCKTDWVGFICLAMLEALEMAMLSLGLSVGSSTTSSIILGGLPLFGCMVPTGWIMSDLLILHVAVQICSFVENAKIKNDDIPISENMCVSKLTSAEATCLAMVKIRLSVISHGGSTCSWNEKTKFKCVFLIVFALNAYRVWFDWSEGTHVAAGTSYLSASPQEAEQVSVLQLFHHCNQRSSEWDHPEELWQEGMRPQLGQKGRKF